MSEKHLLHFSEKFGCAKKTIHQLVSRHGCEITPNQDIGQAKSTNSTQIKKPKKAIEGSKEPSAKHPDPLEILAEEELRLKTAMESRETEILAAAHDIESDLSKREGELNAQRERVRLAIQQTRDLRLSTRADRELIEDLRGDIRSLTIKLNANEKARTALREKNRTLRKELRDSMAREQLLLDTLNKSEADLAACKGSQDPE